MWRTTPEGVGGTGAEEARNVMRRIGVHRARTDNRAIEETAQEILRYIEEPFD